MELGSQFFKAPPVSDKKLGKAYTVVGKPEKEKEHKDKDKQKENDKTKKIQKKDLEEAQYELSRKMKWERMKIEKELSQSMYFLERESLKKGQVKRREIVSRSFCPDIPLHLHKYRPSATGKLNITTTRDHTINITEFKTVSELMKEISKLCKFSLAQDFRVRIEAYNGDVMRVKETTTMDDIVRTFPYGIHVYTVDVVLGNPMARSLTSIDMRTRPKLSSNENNNVNEEDKHRSHSMDIYPTVSNSKPRKTVSTTLPKIHWNDDAMYMVFDF